MNKIFAPFLPPWVETGLQPAFYDMESGTVLQQTARMYAKVQQLTRLFNELSEETQTTVEEYIAKFTELKDFVDDYFDNLDVQDEINNKLDAMVEDGTLADIISQYLNSTAIFGYDTVADMQGADNLIEGSYARTLGYHTINDGGGALYQIKSSVTSDDIYVVIGEDLYAVLAEAEPSANQFGCYGDGTTDDQALLQNYLNYVMAHNGKAILNAGCTYSVASIIINNKIKLFGNGATLKAQGSADVLEVQITTNNTKVYITGLTIDGDNKAEAGLHIIECRNFEFCECEIKNIPNYGIKFDAGYEFYCHNVNIYNTLAHETSYGIYATSGDSVFEDIVIKQFKVGVYNYANSNYYKGIHGWNTLPTIVKGSIFFELNSGCNIDDCYNDTYQYGYKIERSSRNVILRNCMNFTNPNFISSEILDGEHVYLFYFDDASYSSMIDNKGMKVTKGTFDGTIDYSNINKESWGNNQNAIANNPDTASIIGISTMPIGSFYTLSGVDTTKWDIQRQTIVVDDNNVYMNIVAKFLGTTTETADNTIGTLPVKARFVKNVETYCALLDTRYQHPVAMGALYGNSNGEVAVKFADGATATNQFVVIERNMPRNNA